MHFCMHVCLFWGFTAIDLEEEMFLGQEWGLCDYVSDKAHRPPVLKLTAITIHVSQ